MTNIKKIFIIQSLKTLDILKSGEELSKKLSLVIPVDLKCAETDIEIFEHLDKVRDEIANTEDKYVIHFDCHGNEDGIGIYDKADNLSFISWEDLRDTFREIYLVTKKRLIISFSSCKGLNVVKLIAAFKPCPFDLITGSFRKIGFQDSIDGYEYFYVSIHNGDQLEKAMGETRLKYPSLDFAAFTAQKLVKLGWKGYFNLQLTQEKVKERKAKIILKAIYKKGFISKQDIAFIEKRLSNEGAEKDYQRYKKIFFS